VAGRSREPAQNTQKNKHSVDDGLRSKATVDNLQVGHGIILAVKPG
jgi:hypothetical protein